jgi:ribosomal protein S18 acetylase RimI-like enzyme
MSQEALPVHLRPLTPADAELFRRHRLDALREAPAAFSADYETNAQRPLSDFAARIRTAPDNFMMGAFRSDALVGFAGFYRSDGPKQRHKGNIWGMYVVPHARGTGVGRQVLSAIIDRARSLEAIEQIHLSVVADNTAARALYLSTGFETFGREPHALRIGDRYYDEEHMVLFLTHR